MSQAARIRCESLLSISGQQVEKRRRSVARDQVFIVQRKGPNQGAVIVREPSQIGVLGNEKVAVGESCGHSVVGSRCCDRLTRRGVIRHKPIVLAPPAMQPVRSHFVLSRECTLKALLSICSRAAKAIGALTAHAFCARAANSQIGIPVGAPSVSR